MQLFENIQIVCISPKKFKICKKNCLLNNWTSGEFFIRITLSSTHGNLHFLKNTGPGYKEVLQNFFIFIIIFLIFIIIEMLYVQLVSKIVLYL